MSAPWNFVSAMPTVVWPAIPAPAAATLLAFLHQLDRTQWLVPEQLRERQFRQLEILLRHAQSTVPYYAARWRGLFDGNARLTPEMFSALPILTRSELQGGFAELKSSAVPPAHGTVGEGRTSGSTGRPVHTLKTDLTEFFWRAFTVRDHAWHRRDLAGKLAAIRMKVEQGEMENWGVATEQVLATGRAVALPIRTDVATQLDWLVQQNPDYLLSYPSNVGELARMALERGARIPRLRQVRTMGEALSDEVRELCRAAWGVPVTDVYSSDEVGYIALQCPDHEHYHVQAESLMVEVLDADGRACGPGETGRVVVTALHNFALPLVRYELGDYAEAGPRCACGRGLPVLNRIYGRVRNTLVLANGARYWPSFGNHKFRQLAPVLQHQFVQKDFGVIEARLVTARALTESEETALRNFVMTKLPAPFEIRLVYCSEITRSASGKFDDFLSEVARPA